MAFYENKNKYGHTVWKVTRKSIYGQYLSTTYYETRHSACVELARCKSDGLNAKIEPIDVFSDYFDGAKVHDSVTQYEANRNHPPY